MSLGDYTEDTFVQQTTAEYLEKQPDWVPVCARNSQGLGPEKGGIRICRAKSPRSITKGG